MITPFRIPTDWHQRQLRTSSGGQLVQQRANFRHYIVSLKHICGLTNFSGLWIISQRHIGLQWQRVLVFSRRRWLHRSSWGEFCCNSVFCSPCCPTSWIPSCLSICLLHSVRKKRKSVAENKKNKKQIFFLWYHKIYGFQKFLFFYIFPLSALFFRFYSRLH